MEHHATTHGRVTASCALATRTLSWPAGRACAAAFSVAPLDHVVLASCNSIGGANCLASLSRPRLRIFCGNHLNQVMIAFTG
jgi:hypothetical protein